MKFIKLTSEYEDQQPIYVRGDKIFTIELQKICNITQISLESNNYVRVKETPEQIMEMIENTQIDKNKIPGGRAGTFEDFLRDNPNANIREIFKMIKNYYPDKIDEEFDKIYYDTKVKIKIEELQRRK